MKNKLILSLVFIVPLLIYFLLLSINPDTTIEQAAIADSKLPKILVFSTPMCGECRKMSPVIEQAKKNYDGKVQIIKINAADNKKATNKLVKEHQIYLVPTMVYIDKNGNIVNRNEGSMSYIEFENTIKDLMEE